VGVPNMLGSQTNQAILRIMVIIVHDVIGPLKIVLGES